MDNGVKGQSESGKVAGSAAPQPIKPNGFATAYLLVVNLLMIAFSYLVMWLSYTSCTIKDGMQDGLPRSFIGLFLLVNFVGPVLLFLWLVGLLFCKYTHIGKNFYKYGGLVTALITGISFGLPFIFNP